MNSRIDDRLIYKPESTKCCPLCGNNRLILLTTQNLKICTDCDPHTLIEWKLDKGQKPCFC